MTFEQSVRGVSSLVNLQEDHCGKYLKMPPPLRSIISSAVRAVRKHGVVGAWRNAKQLNLRACFWDGGLLVSLLKIDGAVLKGVDNAGNKYWEKMQDQYGIIPPPPGRHRWVQYASAVNYDAAQVPPEWHGWLHHITDHTPEQLADPKPTLYGLDAWDQVPKYMAKGYALHPQRRIWKSFEAWQEQVQSPAIVSSVKAAEAPALKMPFIPEPPGVKLCYDASERGPTEEKVPKNALKTTVTKPDNCFGLKAVQRLADVVPQ